MIRKQVPFFGRQLKLIIYQYLHYGNFYYVWKARACIWTWLTGKFWLFIYRNYCKFQIHKLYILFVMLLVPNINYPSAWGGVNQPRNKISNYCSWTKGDCCNINILLKQMEFQSMQIRLTIFLMNMNQWSKRLLSPC